MRRPEGERATPPITSRKYAARRNANGKGLVVVLPVQRFAVSCCRRWCTVLSSLPTFRLLLRRAFEAGVPRRPEPFSGTFLRIAFVVCSVSKAQPCVRRRLPFCVVVMVVGCREMERKGAKITKIADNESLEVTRITTPAQKGRLRRSAQCSAGPRNSVTFSKVFSKFLFLRRCHFGLFRFSLVSVVEQRTKVGNSTTMILRVLGLYPAHCEVVFVVFHFLFESHTLS